MSAITTEAPRSARTVAVALPMPEPDPVTIATLSCRVNDMALHISFSGGCVDTAASVFQTDNTIKTS
jgi:hypothetical protein